MSSSGMGADVPLLFVIEDLHWADRSTRDLLVFLARNLQDTRVMLIGTYRSDDLHRRHPLRAVLAELERGGTVARIELDRFTRGELRDQLTGILGSAPTVELLDEVFERSEGNPFFAEEIVAATRDGDCRALPPTLRDVLLARIDELPASTREILRTAAVIGRRFPHTLLAAVCERVDERPPRRPSTRGRAPGARDRRRSLLVPSRARAGGGLRRPAAGRAHAAARPVRRAARAASPSCSTAARPSGSARSPATGSRLTTTIRRCPPRSNAARAAEEMYAFPEALAHCERALSLWDRVADAASRVVDDAGSSSPASRRAWPISRAPPIARSRSRATRCGRSTRFPIPSRPGSCTNASRGSSGRWAREPRVSSRTRRPSRWCRPSRCRRRGPPSSRRSGSS